MLVDSHTHLQTFSERIAEVLDAARAVGVGHVVACGMTLGDSEQAIEVARAYPETVSAAVGWHPWAVDRALEDEDLAAFRALVLANRERIRMIGEIGLDYHAPHVERQEAQLQVFRAFVRLAGDLGLPMSIHVRGPAHADTLRVLEEGRTPGLKGSLHGFDGSEAEAGRYLELGLLISAGRSLVQGAESERLQQVFRRLPLERMLVETDAAYRPGRELNPTPALVRDVALKLAELQGVSLEVAERITTRNFEALVGAPWF